MNIVQGNLIATGKKFAIVATRWNEFVVDKLVEGATDTLTRHGAVDDDISVIICPGSFELPLTVKKVAKSGNYDAVIALGAIIRGGTPHFEYIAAEATKGIAHVTNDTEVPVSFGVLTTDTIDQAIERSGTKAGNKGHEAAVTAIEMVSLLEKI